MTYSKHEPSYWLISLLFTLNIFLLSGFVCHSNIHQDSIAQTELVYDGLPTEGQNAVYDKVLSVKASGHNLYRLAISAYLPLLFKHVLAAFNTLVDTKLKVLVQENVQHERPVVFKRFTKRLASQEGPFLDSFQLG